MASLTEVYSGGSGAGLRRLYAGVALFGVGAVLVTAGLVVASTGIGSYLGLGLYRSRELAGILGGLGFPAVLLGTMVALPRASRGLQTAAVVGAGVCLLGVGLLRTDRFDAPTKGVPWRSESDAESSTPSDSPSSER